MDCIQYREALSARVDGEPPVIPADVLDAHLATCPACASWLRAAERVTRLTRLTPAEPVPDLTERVLGAVPEAATARRARRVTLALGLARLVMVGLALGHLSLAYPFLVLGQDSLNSPTHVAHETGAWNAALAVAFVWVALRPRSAPGLLPMLSAFVAILFVVTLPDLLAGHVEGDRVGTHLLTAVGVAVLALMAWREPRPGHPLLGGGRTRRAGLEPTADPTVGLDWSGRGRGAPGTVTSDATTRHGRDHVA